MTLPDITTFTHIKTVSDTFGFKTPLQGATASLYEQATRDTTTSLVIYSIHNKQVYMAWGDKSAEHCACHALLFTQEAQIYPGCASFVIENNLITFTEGNEVISYSF
jgi:hypothetical protein